MELTIASWNIRKAVGLDWRRDPARVLDVLARIGADIVLLQEVDKRLPPRPPALPHDAVFDAGWRWIDSDPATPSIGYHGNTLFLAPHLDPGDVSPIDLPGLEPRGAVLAEVRLEERRLTLGSLHLGLRRRDRRRQLAHVIEMAESLGRPAILGGDLNEWNAEKLPLPGAWQDFTPGASFHASAPVLSLDRFIIGPGVRLVDGGVISPRDAKGASDHLPVWARVEV